jgi:uncharacterized membrane protein
LLFCLLYAAVFSTLAILKHHNFHSHAFDLGIFQQVVWNTAHGDWFHYTYEVGLGGEATTNYLGTHIELILLPIAFLNLFWGSPETLLLVQSFSLAAAGLLVFVIVRRSGGGLLAASLFQVLFYLHPAVQGPNLFDFHPLVLAPAFLLFAFLGLESERFRWVVAGSVLALLCREQVALSVAALAAYGFFRTRQKRMLLIVALAFAWLALTVGVLIPAFHPQGIATHFASKFGYLGKTPAAALTNLVLSPGLFLKTVGDPDRVRYVTDMFFCSGVILPFFAPGVFLVALPEMAVNVFSQETAQRVLTFQYSATAAAFLVLAAARGALWITKRVGARRSMDREPRVRLRGALLGSAAVLLALFFHLSRFGGPYPVGRDPLAHDLRGVYSSSERTRVGYRFLKQIPDGESVSTQSDLAPHLSNRQEIYVFPVIENAKYILLDLEGETFPAQLLGIPYPEQVRRVRADPRYELLFEESGYVLFRRRTNPQATGYSK